MSEGSPEAASGSWKPLSVRHGRSEGYVDAVEGIEPYMRPALSSWVYELIEKNRLPEHELLIKFDIRLQIDRSVENSIQPPEERIAEAITSPWVSTTAALDAIDCLLAYFARAYDKDALEEILLASNSMWKVKASPFPGVNWQLVRRVPAVVAEALNNLSAGERAQEHLSRSWSRLMGLHPDPGYAYKQAVMAIEAAARPVVTPTDEKATLGKMIRALRDNPDRWRVTLPTATGANVANLCSMVWSSQLDRHGTDDPDAPLEASQAEAEAAFFAAVTLVQYFGNGHVVDMKVSESGGD